MTTTLAPESDLGIRLAEAGWLPDRLLRIAIRGICRRRAAALAANGPGQDATFRASLAIGPIAEVADAANEQHYEWPPALFEHVLGPWLKYSCGWWDDSTPDLAHAEEAMLHLTCQRAGIADGMRILDLGCGWGSLSLWIAERYPQARVLGVSNSAPQREFIQARCRERGLSNVEIRTADINTLALDGVFDRVVSIEMFEHMRNWAALLERIAGWLTPEGRLFVHHFAHRAFAYPYEDEGSSDWMARNFFSGGIMPSEHLIQDFPNHLRVERSWRVGGTHYARTSDAWLERLDAAREPLKPVFRETVGEAEAARAHQRWRMFVLACSELFGVLDGSEWFVAHHRLAPTGEASA